MVVENTSAHNMYILLKLKRAATVKLYSSWGFESVAPSLLSVLVFYLSSPNELISKSS